MLAIIGGTGLASLANLTVSHRQIMRTPYGEPSAPLVFGRMGQKETVFLSRHGYGHTIPPHVVNYRANVWALKSAGVTGIVSVGSVGALREEFHFGDIVVPHQLIDYTFGREATFFDGLDGVVRQVDFSDPYDEALRLKIFAAARVLGEPVCAAGVYAATQGPRLETAAEAARLARDKADIVGMTGMPEAILARELELPYAAINLVVNKAGCGEGRYPVSDSIRHALEERMGVIRALLQQIVV